MKKTIQQFMFPNGIIYEHGTGFGTKHKLECYLLLEKMTDKSVKSSIVVAATGILGYKLQKCSKRASARVFAYCISDLQTCFASWVAEPNQGTITTQKPHFRGALAW